MPTGGNMEHNSKKEWRHIYISKQVLDHLQEVKNRLTKLWREGGRKGRITYDDVLVKDLSRFVTGYTKRLQDENEELKHINSKLVQQQRATKEDQFDKIMTHINGKLGFNLKICRGDIEGLDEFIEDDDLKLIRKARGK